MHDETPFRIVLLAVSVIQTAFSVRSLRRARADVTLLRNRQAGITLTAFIVLSYIAYVIAVLAYLIQPSWMEWSHLALPAWARWMAVGPLLMGGALIIQGLHDLGVNLTISPSTKQDHELVTTGSYGWVRHPLYSGLFVESGGVCLLMANWFVMLCAAVFCGLIAFRTRREEDNLIEKFGDEYRPVPTRCRTIHSDLQDP